MSEWIAPFNQLGAIGDEVLDPLVEDYVAIMGEKPYVGRRQTRDGAWSFRLHDNSKRHFGSTREAAEWLVDLVAEARGTKLRQRNDYGG